MKLLFLFTALLFAATAHSEEVNDTARHQPARADPLMQK